jgi:hypothetical protein
MNKGSNRKPPAAHPAATAPAVTVEDTVPVVVTVARVAKAALVDLAVPADAPAASANISAKRKFASFA